MTRRERIQENLDIAKGSIENAIEAWEEKGFTIREAYILNRLQDIADELEKIRNAL